LNLFYIGLEKIEKYTGTNSFTGLGPDDRCSSWGLH